MQRTRTSGQKETSIGRDELAKRLIPSVHAIARQLARRLPSHVAIDDLVGWGMVGLVSAMQRFDPALEESFKSYAELRIRGAILDSLRRQDLLSRDGRAAHKQLDQAAEKLTQRLGRTPSESELADDLGIPLSELHEQQSRFGNAKLVYCDASALADHSSSPAARLQKKETWRQIDGALDKLPQRQRKVVDLFYRGEQSLSEIGRQLGVSASRVCQIRSEAIDKLRLELAA